MLRLILLSPILLIVAALTALMAYNLVAYTTVLLSRAIGLPLRRALGMKQDVEAIGMVVWGIGMVSGLVAMVCMPALPLLIFVGMLWARFGGASDFFITATMVFAVMWPVARTAFVVATGDPKTKDPEEWDRDAWLAKLRRKRSIPKGDLSYRCFTVAPPDGMEVKDGYVFIRTETLRWTDDRGPHVVATTEQVPREDVFPSNNMFSRSRF